MSVGCYQDSSTSALDCAVQGLFGAVGGEGIFALILSGVLVLGFYIASDGGLAVPSVLLTLMGGLIISSLPAQYRSTAQILIFVGLVSGLLALANKYVMDA